MARALRLTTPEIQAVFEDEAMRELFPPILSPKQFAKLLGVSVSTAYVWIAEGRLNGAVTKVGKHRRIWRNRAIEILFNRNQTKSESNESSNN